MEPQSMEKESDMFDKFEKEEQLGGNNSVKTNSDSCIPYFDQLSYCFGPFNQFRYYYTYGSVDTCDTQMDNFWRCVRHKLKGTTTKSTSSAVQQNQPNNMQKPHLWKFREEPPSVFAYPGQTMIWNPENLSKEKDNQKGNTVI